MVKQDEKQEFITPEEYIVFEEVAETKHEYFQGQIYDMAGFCFDQSSISASLCATLFSASKDPSYRAFPSSMRVLVEANGFYSYPDVSVVCGKPHYIQKETANLLNPILLAEIVPVLTPVPDRTSNFDFYQDIPSLQDYLLVAWDKIKVTYYHRQESKKWQVQIYDSIEDTIILEGIGVSVTLRQIYNQTDFVRKI